MPLFRIYGYCEVEAPDEDTALETYDSDSFITGEVVCDDPDYDPDADEEEESK